MIFRYMRERLGRICVSMSVKTVASLGELMIPYILQHMIDEVVPLGEAGLVVLWGLLMVAAALAVRQGNVFANRTAVAVARTAPSTSVRICLSRPPGSPGGRSTASAYPPSSPG